MRPSFAVLRAGQPAEELARVETRLRLHRLATLKLPEPADHFHLTLPARLRRTARTFLPPTRILRMLDAWRTTPGRVSALARRQRPQARFVVLGHTHYPGIWHPPGKSRLTVINTGSFTYPFGGHFVEIEGDGLRVVRIVQVGAEFRPGRVVADFDLGSN